MKIQLRHRPRLAVIGVLFSLALVAVFQIVNLTARPAIDSGDLGFDPFVHINGYEQYAMAFVPADSLQEVEYIKARIDMELINKDILKRSGSSGMVASFVVSLLDIPLLISVIVASVSGISYVWIMSIGIGMGATLGSILSLQKITDTSLELMKSVLMHTSAGFTLAALAVLVSIIFLQRPSKPSVEQSDK